MTRKTPFSERIGGVNPREVLQLGAVNDQLRTRVWNVLYAKYYNSEYQGEYVISVWRDVLNRPVEQVESGGRWPLFRAVFLESDWLAFYDIVEHAADRSRELRRDLAAALELGGSGYRFVDDRLLPITDEQQIAEIETAHGATSTPTLRTVRTHLDAAVTLYADREKPDYRNSVKESVTALEALVNIINGKSGGKTGKTLGEALKELDGMGGTIHKAMGGGLSNLYGWTSDAGGIRHYLKDGASPPGAEEARFMMVTCSALVNFLIAKAGAAGINLST